MRQPLFGALAIAAIAGCASGQRATNDRGGAAASTLEHPYRPGIDVRDYDLAIDLPERGSEIAGRATLTVERAAGVDTLVLDLLDLTVDSVLVDGRRVGARRTATEIGIALPPSLRTVRVTVVYHGVVQDGLIVRTDSAERWTAFGDNWPNRARHWIPSVDHPSDKATVQWTVTAPTGRTVIANGQLVDRTPVAVGRVRWRWRESHPVPVYAMVIAAAPLDVTDLGETACGLSADGGCVHQYVYTAPEQHSSMPGAFVSAAEIVRWFASLIGPFPYEKLAHLQSATRFGGMENASAIFYADGVFRRGRIEESLIAHETAHQWFGDAVTEREWAHVWLSEGFATYFAALFTGHAHGNVAFRASMAQIRAAILADADAVPLRPVIDTTQTDLLALLNRNSYEKGGFVLHMLRREVGDSAFFGALRAYYARHRDGTALTDDLRAEMERVSGRPLGWFFDQWLRRPGYAEPVVTWSYDPSSHHVSLEVAQRGRFGAYRFPLTVELRDARGASTRATMQVPAQPTSRIVLPLAVESPRAVVADPDGDLLARLELHPMP